jgi:hypothetical protein
MFPHFLIDPKTRAVAPFSPDVRTFHNIYKLQKHVLLRHQSKEPSKFAVDKRQNTNYSFLPVTSKLSGVFNLRQHFEISYSRYANKHYNTFY